MTQFQHTLRALLEGDKIETSRLVKPGDYTWICGEIDAPWHKRGTVSQYSAVHNVNHTARFVRGKTYAIQPGRGQKQVGKYVVEAIWRQDVRTLMPSQVRNEGFSSLRAFMETWLKINHDRLLYPLYNSPESNAEHRLKLQLTTRPDDLYLAWRMRIRVLWDTVNWNAPAVTALQIENHPV